jgi:hypothetical protein
VIAFKIRVTSISTDESPNMERSAMFKKYAIHGKRLARVYKYIFMHHMIIWRFFFQMLASHYGSAGEVPPGRN